MNKQLALLAILFLSPLKYYKKYAANHTKQFIILSTIALGICIAQDRLDQKIHQSIIRNIDIPSIPMWGDVITKHINLYIYLVLAGLICALLYWYVGSWWYNTRIRWSGSQNPNRELGKFILFSSSLILAIPQFAVLIIVVPFYDSYGIYYDSLESRIIDIIMCLLGLWSCYASYTGVQTLYTTVKWKAMMWFLILPGLIYGFALLRCTSNLIHYYD